jgi:hypothetical protein
MVTKIYTTQSFNDLAAFIHSTLADDWTKVKWITIDSANVNYVLFYLG